ncbi:hypothetical protein GCK72_004108 [Caenorhabditis remanei]|uniref:Uncharacterized protein n=1 Tax=Caenorhabditis remanei TaxID=31234 RepID=A0A6A5HBB0_CAERE|nr:hypothetical protein GCK72_004108 [Caenorhabditis remanei]KAF1764161.1 hypothetical protein GCK72_004108 [Caenorhabditis remanei]
MSKPRTQPPLFYETAKCVALYLDPNLRFHLNQRCPSFRAIHRTQNMKIGKLRINHADFIMDEIHYRVGIVRKYHSGTTPQSVAIENERGGIQYDVDRYGIPTIPEGAQTREEIPQDEMIRASLERKLMQLERYEAGRHSPRYEIELERRNLELNSYGRRIWNQEPLFEQYLKLTVSSGSKLLKEEFLSYNRNLKQANHYLLKKILGVDGKLLIWVLDYRGDSTTFTSSLADDPQLYYWKPFRPAILKPRNTRVIFDVPIRVIGGRLEIKKLVTIQVLPIVMSILKDIAPADFFPLKLLVVPNKLQPNDPIRDTAEFLNVNGASRIRVLLKLPNMRVHLIECLLVKKDVERLMRKWKEEDNSMVGRCYSMGFQYYWDPKKLLDCFKAFREARLTENPESVYVPLSDTTEVKVWWKETTDEEYCYRPFIAFIKVQERDPALFFKRGSL